MGSGIIFKLEPLYFRQFMDELDSTKPSLTESDLLDPYEKLVIVEILGKQVQVPEKNRLLRCFQYLSLNSISYGDFCLEWRMYELSDLVSRERSVRKQ